MAKNDANTLVEPFAEALQQAAGKNLVSLLMYGSAVRGDYDAKHSDVNLVVILSDASSDALRPLGSTVAKWVKGGQPPPLIFAESGWRASTDVFPIEIEDMRQAHRVVRGIDPFEGITTTAADLRQELEREARGKLIQLRAAYVAAEADGKALGSLLAASAKTFFVLFRAALRLKQRIPPEEHQALVQETAEITDIDPGSFTWVMARLRGERQPDLRAYDPIGAQYMEAIVAFVDFIDRADSQGERQS